VESPARCGDLKKSLNMISEGSVLLARNPVRGTAPDVAPDGFAHPVYRAGFALAIPIPWAGGIMRYWLYLPDSAASGRYRERRRKNCSPMAEAK
jgi:hypothetical protein